MSEHYFNIKEFHQSVTKELTLLKNRVRNLIGDKHWGEEGSYKETVLRNVIKRFLPSNLACGTGFITDIRASTVQNSKQIDILIFDNSFPVLFNEGDFYIVTPDCVKAIIEVKTTIEISGKNSLKKIIEKMNNNGDLIRNRDRQIGFKKTFFNGIFGFSSKYFEYDENNQIISEKIESIQNVLEDISFNNENHVSFVAFDQNYFMKCYPNSDPSGFKLVELENLAFSYFISNIIDYIGKNQISMETWYPVDKNSLIKRFIPIRFPYMDNNR